MAYQLSAFSPAGLSRALLETLIRDHQARSVPLLSIFWTYYRNPIVALSGSAIGLSGRGRQSTSGRLYRLGQERGLPSRLTGHNPANVNEDDRAFSADTSGRREVVIENDIAWRIHTMVDFMFGRPITLLSTAAAEGRRRDIERVLDAVWEASGGIALLQDIGLLGHVYGHVDLLIRRNHGQGHSANAGAEDVAATVVRVEVVEPTRGIPLQNKNDFRQLDAYILRYERESTEIDPGYASSLSAIRPGILIRLLARSPDSSPQSTAGERRITTVTEVFSGTDHHIYEEEQGSSTGPQLIEAGVNDIFPGRTPVVHIQNVSQPYAYAGIGEVEPLIPLQDELNTRLSDRASRVTMQAFKMYLAKGLDGFEKAPVGPGMVWSTDNMDAQVSSFGGDAAAQGEDAHIEQIREAIDKASAVPPLATGVVRAKIGNLTSENALRVTLMGLLSRTARKRISYGRGIAEASRLILTALDHAGVFTTAPDERGVRVEWSDPLPRNEQDTLAAALSKVQLGVPRERVLSELGYAPTDPGIV